MINQPPVTGFRAIAIVHGALAAGLLFFIAIAFFIQANGFAPVLPGEFENIVLVLIPILLSIVLLVSRRYINARVANIKERSEKIESKKPAYFSLLIIKWATYEGSGFLSCIMFLLTANYIFFGLSLFLAGLLILQYPSVSKATEELNLNPDEINQLMNS